MRRRSRAGGETAKTRRRKTLARKRGNAPKAAVRRGSSAVGLSEQVALFKRERDEALEQQKATAEILRVIRTSPADVQPVFETIVRNAVSLCGSLFANVFRFDGELLHWQASHNVGPSFVDLLKAKFPMRPDSSQVAGRAVLIKSVVRLEDALSDPDYDQRFPRAMGWRRLLGVPMLRGDELLGVIVVGWAESGPVPKAQEDLLKTFADQAVIAIENVRLFEAEQQRTRELSESLEQQTATSEVLGVISSSPGRLEPVFQSVLDNAARICDAKFGFMNRYESDTWKIVAVHGAVPAYTEYLQEHGYKRPGPETVVTRIATTGQLVHIADLAASRGYAERDPVVVAAVELGGVRTMLGVPMLKEGKLIGAILLYRQEVRPFTDKQIALVQNFAAQAVIAIENTRLLNELRESLQQQTATADVLKVISRSTFDLQTVLDTLVESAARLCEADMAQIMRPTEAGYYVAARYGFSSEYVEYHKTLTTPSGRASLTGRVLLEGKAVQIPDVLADPEYSLAEPQRLGGYRTHLGVPLLREGSPIGVILVSRRTVRPFDNKHVELISTFADQAVIAIENVRLFEAEQQRTRELTESLEQQTATSEVLKAISSSPGALAPVFDAMLSNATRLCEAQFGALILCEGDAFRVGALHNVPPAFADLLCRGSIRPGPNISFARAVREKQPVQYADVTKETSFIERDPLAIAAVELGGYRTILSVPMLKESEPIGVIVMFRQEVRPFGGKQIELVKNFADQAVIAIENARLLNELRHRTADLTESLEQQTATSEVLKVISSSPGDLQPVFSAMLESAARLCDASFGNIFRWEDDALCLVATYNTPAAFVEARSQLPLRRNQNNPIGEMLAAKTVLHVDDLAADERYTKRRDPNVIAAVELGGIRTFLAVPMLNDNELIGALIVYRQEVRSFSDKQIELVKNFAAQAVIAIENARLLNELRQSLEQQTATSEVLKVVSSSPGDVQPVFAAMLENAVRICDAKFGVVYRCDGDAMRFVAMHNVPPALAALSRAAPFRPSPKHYFGPMIATKTVVHVADLAAEQGYIERRPEYVEAVEAGGVRTYVAVPMLKDSELIGVFLMGRQDVRSFTDKQIALVQNFAAQAVIAIENVRLLNELRQRTTDLTESLEQQTATSEVLKVISSSPGDLQPVFDAMLMSATRLCEASYGTMWLHESDGQMRVGARCGDLPEAFNEQWRIGRLFRPSPSIPTARVFATHKLLQVADLREDRSYLERDPLAVSSVDEAGIRTLVSVPMLKQGAVVGTVNVYRREVRPFTEKQIALLQNFADQALVAIENTRLLNELRLRTTDLTESLEQQTATSKVLEVISRAAFDLQAVFETVAESSVRLCGADRAFIFRFDGELLRMVVAYNSPPEFSEWVEQHPVRPGRHSSAARAALERRTIHIPDVLADPEYSYGAKDVEKIRTVVAVPILKGDDLLGVMIIYHLEGVRPFTDKQIALVETFADQAAIAIDNVRLLDELRHRTDDLGRSVSELRALGEVSQAVNSTLDLEIVLSTIVAKAVQLSGTEAGAIYGYDEQWREFRLRATYGMDQALIDALTQRHIGLEEPNVAAALVQREPTQVADLREEAASELNEIILRAGYRARMVAPLLRGEDIVGMLVVRRRTLGEFPQNTVDLIKTFAAQSALAIQNARLFHEIEDKGRQLEEASQHKSQFLANMSHELRTPLNAILGYTELMADGAYGEPSEKMLGILKRLEANGRHLLGLINDVLDLSKIEAGQLVLELSDYSVQDIAQTVRSTLEPLAADKKLGFKVEVAPNLPSGRGDGRRLTQVLINLVGNAIKFTDAGEVAIKAEANNGAFRVSVRDTGPGISAADQSKLFQEFQQADNAITKKKGGTGLGLAISKRIIEMHGGRIWVESQPGQGSTFAFSLPMIVERQVESA